MKKELFIPILILALTIAFAVVSAMVFLNGGKSATLVRRKLRLGAMLLTFNAMIWGAKAQDDEDYEPLCYYKGPSKTPFFYGPDISINTGSGSKLILPELNKEPIADYSASGYGFSAGAYTQVFLGDIRDTRHSLKIEINYSSSKMSMELPVFSSTNYIEPIFDENLNPYTLTERVEHKLSSIDLKMLYQFVFFSNFSVAFGPNIKYIVESNLTEQVSIDESSRGKTSFSSNITPLRFENSNQTAVLSDGTPKGSRDFVLCINSDFSYEFITGTGMDFIPYFGVSKTLTSINTKSNWHIDTIYGGLAIRFKFFY